MVAEVLLEVGMVAEVLLEVGIVVEVLEVGITEELLLEVGIVAEVLLEVWIVVEVLEVGTTEEVLMEVGTAVGGLLEAGIVEEVLLAHGIVERVLLGTGIVDVLLAAGTVVAALLVAGTTEEEDGIIEDFPAVGTVEVFLAVGTVVEALAGEALEVVDGTTGVLLREGGGTIGEVEGGGLPVEVLLGGMIGDQAGVLAVAEIRDGIPDLVEGDGMAVVGEVLRAAGVMIEGMHQVGTMEEVAVEDTGAVGSAETGEEIHRRAAAAGEIEGEFQGHTLRVLRSSKKRK
jgi:hypothetical protein